MAIILLQYMLRGRALPSELYHDSSFRVKQFNFALDEQRITSIRIVSLLRQAFERREKRSNNR
jgi:hypothetical protein